MDGWIKLHRKLLSSEVAKWGPEFIWLWVLCLLLANHKSTQVKIGGISTPVVLGPGEFMTSRNTLYVAYHGGLLRKGIKNEQQTKKMSSRNDCCSNLEDGTREQAPTVRLGQKPAAQTLWRWLKYLEEIGNLSIRSYSKYSIISITNWTGYQINEQQLPHEQQKICGIQGQEPFCESCPHKNEHQVSTYKKNNTLSGSSKRGSRSKYSPEVQGNAAIIEEYLHLVHETEWECRYPMSFGKDRAIIYRLVQKLEVDLIKKMMDRLVELVKDPRETWFKSFSLEVLEKYQHRLLQDVQKEMREEEMYYGQ